MQPSQIPMNFEFRAATGREDFLVTPANEDAVAWIDKWPDWPMRSLLLVGPVGAGKTHLAHVWQTGTGARVINAEKLGHLDIEEISKIAGHPLVVENAGPGMNEEALLHLFNLVQEKGGSLLMTTATVPSAWNVALKDLSSRLGTIPVARIHEPDDALFAALVVKLFSDRQLAVTPDVVQYITQRLERSFAEARRFVRLLDKSALAKKRKITISLLRDVFKEEQG
ncbi:DnaA/Hda family protein [Sneathiella sp.]|uniref:HdaA/DnaA family protein n=1 Tax=Sneathiella sp. TaxID=1964365 RepID=UPI0026130DC0|nr:DnaA/Hda family protein [Sneathiella sp.]MDF2368050.1 DnaA/Hda family protein [Sneathiella sp.]